MESGTPAPEKRAPVSWIALYSALLGATSIIPIFPYVGGGGYWPLSLPLAAIAPFILGLPAATLSAFIGGLIGWVLSPAAYPLGIVDVILTGTMPAIAVGLTMNANKMRYYAILIPLYISQVVTINLVPYYIPGPAGGFDEAPQPLYFLLFLPTWLPWLVILLTPIGFRTLPKLIREGVGAKRFVAMYFTILIGMFLWWMPWEYPYWYVYKYPVTLTIATVSVYLIWVPVLCVIITIISIPIVEGLRRSGLPKVAGAIW